MLSPCRHEMCMKCISTLLARRGNFEHCKCSCGSTITGHSFGERDRNGFCVHMEDECQHNIVEPDRDRDPYRLFAKEVKADGNLDVGSGLLYIARYVNEGGTPKIVRLTARFNSRGFVDENAAESMFRNLYRPITFLVPDNRNVHLSISSLGIRPCCWLGKHSNRAHRLSQRDENDENESPLQRSLAVIGAAKSLKETRALSLSCELGSGVRRRTSAVRYGGK